MKKNVLASLTLTGAFLLMAGLLFGHHSNSMYDEEHYVSLTGTVAKFEFINPHVLIHLDVKDGAGSIVTWVTLGGPPNRMAKGSNWTRKTFTQGEELTIIGFPFRDNRPGMLFQKIMRANGEAVPISETVTNFTARQEREIPVLRKYGSRTK